MGKKKLAGNVFLNKWSETAGRFGQITFLKPYDPPEGVSFVKKKNILKWSLWRENLSDHFFDTINNMAFVLFQCQQHGCQN